MSAPDVISFWFEEIEPGQRYKKDPEFDELIKSRFGGLHARATQGELYAWRDHPLDSLAEIIIKAFLYMPFMHSESAEIHKIAIYLFDHPGLEDNYNYELRHKEIIDRFDRYPHRNEILNRESTEEELEFLSQPGSSF